MQVRETDSLGYWAERNIPFSYYTIYLQNKYHHKIQTETHMKYFILLAAMMSAPSLADELVAVVGVEHLSSPTHGVPFNNKQETSVDMAYLGLRYSVKQWNFEVDVAHAFDDKKELHGQNPRAIFRVEREFKIFSR